MSNQLLFQRHKELFLGQVPGCLEPILHALQRQPLFLRCGSSLYTRDSLAVFEPVKLKAKEGECSILFTAWMETAKPENPGLARLHLQFVLSQPFRQHVIKSSCIFPLLCRKMSAISPASRVAPFVSMCRIVFRAQESDGPPKFLVHLFLHATA